MSDGSQRPTKKLSLLRDDMEILLEECADVSGAG